VDGRSWASGQFIVLEGPDGAGKSVIAADLVAGLRRDGFRVTATREPGGTGLGELIRTLLLDPGAADRAPESDALLFAAARAQLVRDVIKPALDRGEIVVSDRFAPSTLAYQGYGAGVDLPLLRRLEDLATAGLRPDLVLLLDVPVEVGLGRRTRGRASDLTRFEDPTRHGTAFHQRVREGYLALAAAEPSTWRVVDGARPRATVAADVRGIVQELMPESEPNPTLVRMQS
jgi:dTMP kinase